MTMYSLSVLNRDAQEVHQWLNDIQKALNWNKDEDRRTLAVFRAVLWTLRDNMLVENLSHFIAPLPIFIKGLVFEQWKPTNIPYKERTKDEFLTGVNSYLPESFPNELTESCARAVLKTLTSRMPETMEKIKEKVKGARELMP